MFASSSSSSSKSNCSPSKAGSSTSSNRGGSSRNERLPLIPIVIGTPKSYGAILPYYNFLKQATSGLSSSQVCKSLKIKT